MGRPCAGVGEGCPREYVTGESVESALAFVAGHRDDWQASIRDVATLSEWVERHRAAIDAAPAAWTAAELALLDLIGHVEGRPVESLLGLAPLAGCFHYTAVLGDGTPAIFQMQLNRYLRAGFRDFKIKLGGDFARDEAKIRTLEAAGLDASAVRADANNLWADAALAIDYVAALAFPFRAIEEPLRPGDFTGMRRMADALHTRIILDESALRVEHLAEIQEDPYRWIANVRVSKMGGLLRSLHFTAEARRSGVPIVVGAHVGETSVLARAALALAHAFPDGVIAREGAFGTHLLDRDVVAPSIVFGAGGVVDVAALAIGASGTRPRADGARATDQLSNFATADAAFD